MTPPTPTTIRCTACGTEFSSTDAEEVQNHEGHPQELVQQA
ncbi:MAG: hypothetical protein WAN87_01020 [Thermoplasmata archaeon]